MHSFKEKLGTLKKMLEEENEFSVIFEYFFDHFGENGYFLSGCKKAKHPLIKAFLKRLGELLFGDDGAATNLQLFKYSKANFYHGVCIMHGRMVVVFFFDNLKKGMAAVHVSPFTNEIKYIRFTGTVVDGNKTIVIPDVQHKVLQ